MESTVGLALPCRLVTLKVLLGPEEGLTTLEDLVARAIAAGRTTVDQQAELFALPRRIILEVVHSLWSKGYIIVGFTSGTLELTDGTRDLLTKGGLRGEAAKLEHRQFVFEPITGHIFPEFRGMARPPDNSLDVPPHEGITEADLSPQQLLAAVQEALSHQRRMGFRQNVLDVSFGSPVLRPPTERRWLQIRASVEIDDATDRLSITIRDEHRMWGAAGADRVAQYLADLADEQPDLELVRQLRGQAKRGLKKPKTLRALLDRMAATVAELPALDLKQVALKQSELEEQALKISDRVAATEAARAQATLIEHAAGYSWAIDELIAKARSQLVIVSPYIHYSTLNHLLPALERALEQGVGIAVLWGRAGNDELPHAVRTAFNGLKTRFSSRLLIDKGSSMTDACVIIQDGRRALLGSQPPLSLDATQDRGQIGVLVEPTGKSAPPPQCVTDLLIWARRAYPYWKDGQRIELQVADSRRPQGPRTAPGGDELPDAGSVSDAPSLRLWARDWAKHHQTLAVAVRQATADAPAVEVVRDGAHRDLISLALQTAGSRLVICDDRCDNRVANDHMATLIRKRAAICGAVHLMHPASTVTGAAGRGFAELATAEEAGVHVRHRKAGVRAVLSDDEVLLGSYSPLSEGGRPNRVGKISQLGLLIRGTAFADEFARALRIAEPRATPEEQASTDREASVLAADDLDGPLPTTSDRALALLAQARRDAQSGKGFAPIVRAEFDGHPRPWEVLELWAEAEVPADEMRRGAAVLLSGDRELPDQVRGRWAGWLAADCWRRRSFVEAAVVGRMLPATSEGLPAAACAAAAALEVGPLDGLLTEAALDLIDGPPAALSMAAIAGIAEIVRWGGAEGADVISEFRPKLPGTWRQLAGAVLRYNDQAHGAPLPMASITAALAQSTELAEIETRWRDVADQVDKLRRLRTRFTFPAGLALHDGLFAPDGLLTRIHNAAGDPSLRPKLMALLPKDVSSHLNAVVADAGQEAVAWRKHNNYRERVRRLVRQTGELLQKASFDPDETADPAGTSAAAAELGRFLNGHWDLLFSEAETVSAPYNQPMMALLDVLGPLSRWAKRQP